MPRYAALIYGPDETDTNTSPAEWSAMMADYDDFSARATAAGVLSGGEALQETTAATTVHVVGGAKGGEVITTDGPFAETKEVLGGGRALAPLLECARRDARPDRSNRRVARSLRPRAAVLAER